MRARGERPRVLGTPGKRKRTDGPKTVKLGVERNAACAEEYHTPTRLMSEWRLMSEAENEVHSYVPGWPCRWPLPPAQ